MTIRVLITDDHKVVRRGLRGFLELDPALEVVEEAGNGQEALELVRSLSPDVEVVALTSVLEDASVTGDIRAGEIGYLLKTTDADELCGAIKAAAAGKVQLAPEAAAHLVHEVRVPDSPEALTERETEVLRLVAHGKANKQIARELSIDESTIKSHVHSILSKLDVKSRTQTALHAVHVGLVSADELGEKSR